ncbi:hypothetical protein DM02DRAFT_617156 [Periconia macrospinosa]|uniref:Uncharacterized protein n=1 Tax=Periconia macrospinosa TaxID=97972 RepID=A0A2V1DET0_9PLEO|nr:hypothetical protein DM02DRAFT_617156 [Periconia macrospinosa]
MGRGGNDFTKLVSGAGAAAAIGGAYKFGEFLFHAKKLRDVGPANAVYVRLISRIRADLDEVRRLLTVREVHDALEANKDKAKWVYGAMRDVRGALENITPHTERVGGDVEAGRRIGIRHRVYWLMSEKEKLENREKELLVAHSSLNEVLGYLTALEPDESKHKGKHHHADSEKVEKQVEKVEKKVDIDIDVRHDAPGRERVEREVWIEHDDRRPSRRVVEERETWVEHETRAPRRVEERYVQHEHRGPRHVEEHYVEHEQRGPGHHDQRETWVDEYGRPRRYEEREVYVDQYGPRQPDGRYVDERELHVERDPRDPRHVEARYSERGPTHYEEKRYEERRFNEPLGRRSESFEDRVPERESWRQSEIRRPQMGGRPSQYAEYGAPQPVGAAYYNRRKFDGDPGFGDEEVLNPQIVPPNPDFDREVSPSSSVYPPPHPPPPPSKWER